MQQLEFFDIPNPCRNICISDNKGYCKGCMRSRNERMMWNSLSNEEKKNTLRLCENRRRRKLREALKVYIGQQKKEEKIIPPYDLFDE